jgi:hypothetical protein
MHYGLFECHVALRSAFAMAKRQPTGQHVADKRLNLFGFGTKIERFLGD